MELIKVLKENLQCNFTGDDFWLSARLSSSLSKKLRRGLHEGDMPFIDLQPCASIYKCMYLCIYSISEK